MLLIQIFNRISASKNWLISQDWEIVHWNTMTYISNENI